MHAYSCLHVVAAVNGAGPHSPTVTVEVTVSQGLDGLLSDLATWVSPHPRGAAASLAIGVNIHVPAAATAAAVREPPCMQMQACLAYHTGADDSPWGGVAISTLDFGDNTRCPCGPGMFHDPSFFMWLPLRQLLPGSCWYERAWLGARIAASGVWHGLAALVLPCPSLEGLRWAWARWRAPWGAVPLDLAEVKGNVT